MVKKRTVVGLLVWVFFTVGTMTAHAGFMDRIADQQRRIDQGIASNSLTRQEADIVQDNLNWIKAEFAKLKADRRLTRVEQRKLDSMLDKNSRMIAKKKHNPIIRVYGDAFLERINAQQRRIDNGIAGGTLSRGEADIVQDNLNWIKHRYSTMKADRRLTRKEAQRLDRMLDQNSRMIESKKHNPIRRVY